MSLPVQTQDRVDKINQLIDDLHADTTVLRNETLEGLEAVESHLSLLIEGLEEDDDDFDEESIEEEDEWEWDYDDPEDY